MLKYYVACLAYLLDFTSIGANNGCKLNDHTYAYVTFDGLVSRDIRCLANVSTIYLLPRVPTLYI